MDADSNHLNEIVEHCIERYATEGEAAIEAACAKHPQLATRIRSRVQLLVQAGLLDVDEADTTPEAIGPYRVLQVLGEGGMGVVYLAEQREPFRRRVAIKRIKLGMDTKKVLGRFENERQALAIMQHENIARVFDAGQTEDGRPYFVMEYVEGTAFSNYCDDHKLELRERLDLFCDVCAGVQHAHQKGIIHRDLKPSNVLVTVQSGGRALPKIIDFGLARATDHQLTDTTVFTEHGQLLGTPEYISPEQTDHGRLAVDTRTDIYSLGVMLYELIAGELPFGSAELRAVSPLEARQLIRESDPAKPSDRLSTRGADGDHVAVRRRTDRTALVRRIRGDLDWIVMKAIEKDPTRRYQSVSELAADIQRHLNNLPVEAGPPSLRYRLGKFLGRYRWQVASAVAALVFLLVSLFAMWRLYSNADDARATANKERQLADEQRELAETSLEDAMDAVDSMLTRLGESGLAEVPHLDELRRSILEDALAFHERFLEHRGTSPRVQYRTALALIRVGDIQSRLGDPESAEEALRRAVSIFDRLVAATPNSWRLLQPLADAHARLAYVLHLRGQNDESREAWQRVGSITRKVRARGDGIGPRLASRLARTLTMRASALMQFGQMEEVEADFKAAVELRRRLADAEPKSQKTAWSLADAHRGLGAFYVMQVRFEEASQQLRAASKLATGLEDRAKTSILAAQSYIRLHQAMQRLSIGQRRWSRATKHGRAALSVLERLRADFPTRLDLEVEEGKLRGAYARALRGAGKNTLAEKEAREAVGVFERRHEAAPNSPSYLLALALAHRDLAYTLPDTRLDEQISHLESCIANCDAVLEKREDYLVRRVLPSVCSNLGRAMLRRNDVQRARELAARALDADRKLRAIGKSGPWSKTREETQLFLAYLHMREENPDAAAAILVAEIRAGGVRASSIRRYDFFRPLLERDDLRSAIDAK